MEKFYNLIEDRYSYPIAATLVDDRYLYFVTCYNNILYKLDLETDEYEEILMPIGNKKAEAFWYVIQYCNKLLFIPYQESFFLEFDMENKQFSLFLENYMRDMGVKHLFRDYVLDDNNLVLLDMTYQKIIVIDLNTKMVINEISLDKYATIVKSSFFGMKLKGKDLYVFGKMDKKILKVNYINGKINVIRTCHEIYYAECDGDNIFYMPHPEYEPQIFCLNIKTGKTKCLGNVEVQKSKGVAHTRYWRPTKIGDEIVFLAYESMEVVVYSMEDKTLNIVKPYMEKYKSYHLNYHRALSEIIKYKEGFIVIPLSGNTIFLLDSAKGVKKEYRFMISDEIVQNMILGYEGTNEIYEGVAVLEDFIQYVDKNG